MADPAAQSGPVHGRCTRCGQAVIGCRDAEGRLIPVHPVAIPGGELIVNGLGGTIVRVLSHREAAAAQRRQELGFTPHSRVCRARNPAGVGLAHAGGVRLSNASPA